MTAAKSDFSILVKTLAWLLLTLVFYFVLRLEFLVWNWKEWFENLAPASLMMAFLQGIRFDLSSLTWLSSIIIAGALLPWSAVSLEIKEKTLKTTFLLVHAPFLVLNAIDLEFVHFAGRRMTTDSLYLLGESNGKWSALWGTYWLLFILNLGLLWIFYRVISGWDIDLTSENPLRKSYARLWGRILITFLILLFLVIAARGGVQPKPLEMAHATALSTDFRLTHLTLNSSFTTLHSLQKKRLKRIDYYKNPDELQGFLNGHDAGETILPWDKKPKNVVLFVLESFGLEYTGLDNETLTLKKRSFTPFLDSLKTNSLYFENSFANGRRSIEALPSLLAGIPALMDEPFLTSTFQTNSIPSLGTELAQKGVWSAFFHGGSNGTMFFEEFTQRLGFQHYVGKNEYPHQGDDDGTWGIWDGPFLNFFGTSLNQAPTPFFAVFFSLSSHHPFKVPENYRDQLPKGPLPILQSVAYTDAMLADFFKSFARSPWFKDTLFIFTADHTSKSYLAPYQTALGSFRVPLLLYFPGAAFSAQKNLIDTLQPVQHIDLLPTLADLFTLPTSGSLMGRSLLKTGPRKVTLYLDERQILVTKDSNLLLSTEDDPPPLGHSLLPAWKAHRQYFINNMLDNHLLH